MEAKISEERDYTAQATEDLLLKILEKEFREAMQDVLEERRKITDPDICKIFNLWYLRNHVNDIQKEMQDGFAGIRQEMEDRFAGLRQEMEDRFEKMEGQFEKMEGQFEKMEGRFERIDDRFERMDQRISQIFIFFGVGFTILAALITLFQFMA